MIFLLPGDQIGRLSRSRCHERSEARGEVGDRSPAVRDDETDVGTPREGARQDEAVDRAGAVERIFQNRRRQPEAQPREAGWLRGMNEDHGLTTLQLVEQRRKALIAEIGSGVVGQDADSIETEGVEGMGDFPQRRIDIR
jgi:hypothetical protein